MLFAVPLVTLFLSVGCWGQYFSEADSMSIYPVSGLAGDTITVSVGLENSFSIGGFQIRMTYDYGTFSPLSMRLGNHSLNYNLFGADFGTPGVVSVYATSWNPLSNPIVPGDGPIAILDFFVLEDAQPGSFAFNLEDSDTMSHQNSLSNCTGDSLVIPVLISNQIEILPGSGVGEDQPIPTKFMLFQNYPNPFNGATRISFEVEKPETVELTVYDILGHTVATLFSGPAPSGEISLYWDGRVDGQSISSGLYFYRIYGSQSGAITKTMTLLK